MRKETGSLWRICDPPSPALTDYFIFFLHIIRRSDGDNDDDDVCSSLGFHDYFL